jgi:hypothetical protein
MLSALIFTPASMMNEDEILCRRLYHLALHPPEQNPRAVTRPGQTLPRCDAKMLKFINI